ncbi:MAG: IS3 family transposase [Mycobacteriales bacterium]
MGEPGASRGARRVREAAPGKRTSHGWHRAPGRLHRPATAVVVNFIDAHRDRFGVEPICRVLTEHQVKIAPATYYAFKTRPPSARSVADTELLVHIERIYQHPRIGRGVYGARKVWHQLRREDICAARCTVERLMRRAGLRGVRRGRQFITTRRDTAAARPPDLVNRIFHAERPNALWVVDITYVATWSGMAFTAFVSDVFSRRIVGWRTAASMPTELPLDALEMALWIRSRAGQTVGGLIHHSDAGSQYTSIRYTNRLLDAGAVASIGTVGDSFDNALAETVVGLYKAECTHREGPFRGVDDLELATANWVGWFNETRLHSALGYLPPIEYEAIYHAAQRLPAA